MSSGLKMRHGLVVAALGIILSFQNCSNVEDTEGEAEASSFESGLPHAYDAKMDTIAFMSCSGMNKGGFEKRGYFSYKVGAYNPASGGLRMSNEFREATKYYSPSDLARMFSTSDVNSNTRLNLSIRKVGELQSIWKEGDVRSGEDIDTFLPGLDTAPIAGPLSAMKEKDTNGKEIRRQYFPGSHTQRLMEATLRFYHFEDTLKESRTNVSSDYLLVAGYSNSTEDMDLALRGPSGLDKNKVFGTGYRFSFSRPYGYQEAETRVISSFDGIKEIDMRTGNEVSANWDCSAKYQFMIIRPEDWADNIVACNPGPDSADSNNPEELKAYTAIRRVLRNEDWFVDMSRRCIMPKRTGDYCYGDLQGRTIQYSTNRCFETATTKCPHFVSVCIRG